MILVVGATGQIGRALISLLAAGEVDVRALVRNRGTAPDFGPEVDVREGRLEETDELDDAFQGVERVFLLGPDHALPDQAENLVKVAKRTGVRQIVMNSSLSVEIPGDNPLKHEHAAAERTIVDSGLKWTLLRGGVYDSNALFWEESIRDEDKVLHNRRNDPFAPIDPDDIAAVAAEVLTSDGHDGQTYGLTGPEQITPEQQAGVLAELRGQPIVFVELSEAEALEAALDNSGPRGVDFLKAMRRQDLPWLTPRRDVERVTGRKGNTFRQWAERNIDQFL